MMNRGTPILGDLHFPIIRHAKTLVEDGRRAPHAVTIDQLAGLVGGAVQAEGHHVQGQGHGAAEEATEVKAETSASSMGMCTRWCPRSESLSWCLAKSNNYIWLVV